MDAEGSKEPADVIPDPKHLDLTGSETRGRAVCLSSGCPSNSPKTPTTRSPLLSGGTELISTATHAPAVETKTPVESVAGAVPS
jgi:hypothetical protein